MELNFDSEEQNDFFDDRTFKKVDSYEGRISDSQDLDSQEDEEDSSYGSKERRFSRRITATRSNERMPKTKGVRKNSESAKLSRQRRKVYIATLQQISQELTQELGERQYNIESMSASILEAFRRSNLQKYKYLLRKLELSRKLLTMSQRHQQLQTKEHSVADSKQAAPEAAEGGQSDRKKRKKEEKRLSEIESVRESIRDKESAIEQGINSYLYEFGAEGCLRWDVIERTKYEWMRLAQPAANMPAVQSGIGHMAGCMQDLERKTKSLDYQLRHLKEKVKDRFVIQFLLDKEFFMQKNEGTIFKRRPLVTIEEESQ